MTSAARINQGWFCSEAWNARAVPWKVPCTLVGTPISSSVWRTEAVASESDTPCGRLNEMVEAANCPWWFTPSGVLVGP